MPMITTLGPWTVAAATSSYVPHPMPAALSGLRETVGIGAVELEVTPGKELAESLERDPGSVAEEINGYGLQIVAANADADVDTASGFEHARWLLGVVAELGAQVLTVRATSGGANLTTNLAALAELGRSGGVIVAVETHGTRLGTGIAVSRALPEQARDVKLTYDTGNVQYYGGVSATEDLPLVVERVGMVHLKDCIGGQGNWNFPPLGSGTLDVAATLATLRAAGYAGTLALEVEFDGELSPSVHDVDRALAQSLAFLARVAEADRATPTVP